MTAKVPVARGVPDAPGTRRRAVAASLVRAVLTSTSLVLLYFVVPVTGSLTVSIGVLLAVGLVAFVGMLALQIRSVMLSPSPRLRALEVLATAAPLFLLLFAMSYFLMAHNNASTFSQPLSRLDAVYFTVTVFATVGFGDIVALSQTARAVVTVQMVGDLVLIGLGARMLLGAVQVGLSRRESKVEDRAGDGASTPADGGQQHPTHPVH